MKTRSNMPLFVVECTDITKLSDSDIDLLRCGDYLVKKTGKQNHAYKVTYKEDKQGICLTYHDASCVETVSYDYTNGHWVYNSTDKALLPLKDGNVYEFDGDLNVDGKITGDEIVENMSGYSMSMTGSALTGWTIEPVYGGAVKNGNKLTFVIAINMTKGADALNYGALGTITIPSSIGAKLFPTEIGGYNFLYIQSAYVMSGTHIHNIEWYIQKLSNTSLNVGLSRLNDLELSEKFYVRLEVTFLLSDNLIPQE